MESIEAAAVLARNLSIHVASKDPLDVREFAIADAISSLFEVTLTAVKRNTTNGIVSHARSSFLFHLSEK